jgi:hypothetical protein
MADVVIVAMAIASAVSLLIVSPHEALNEACCHDLPCEGDPADHEIVAIGPSLGYYIFL